MKISELVSEGAFGAFKAGLVKGATGGRINLDDPNISGKAQIGAALLNKAGLHSTADTVTQLGFQQAAGTQGGTGTTPKINPNQTVDMPPLGKVKLKPTVGGGIEIDTRGTDLAKQGIPKLNIDRQTLQQMQAGTAR